MQLSIDHGSFLIRKSGNRPGECTLSLRNLKEVKHFKINKLDDESFYLTPKETFKTISELVAHYNRQTLPITNYQNIKLKGICLTQPHRVDSSRGVGETWEASRESIHLIKKIGTGAFSEVWEGIWSKKYSIRVAVKKPKTGTASTNKYHKEVELLKQLSHPKIIQLYAVCTKEEPIYIITELMKHGSLLDYLRGDGHSLKLSQLIDMGAQVAAGMAYLEDKNYVHQHLAARNILVGENLICKVANFGLAHVINEDIYEEHTRAKFPIKWTAPEAAMYNRFTIKSDVWSFGILLFELITYGHFPYPGMNNAQVLEALQTGYRMPCPMGCPEQLYQIMQECWKDEATSRPTFKTLQHRMDKFHVEIEHTPPSYSQVRYSYLLMLHVATTEIHACIVMYICMYVYMFSICCEVACIYAIWNPKF